MGWGGFGTDFGRIWQGFGKVLGGVEKFWEDLGKVLKAFSQAFLCQDPRAVSRSPAERPNARGSPTPQRVEWYFTNLPSQPPLGGASPPSEEASRIPSVFWWQSFWRGLGSLFYICLHFFRFFYAS